jgi:dihydrofolate reductase
MMKISLIVAVDEQNGIGKAQQLLCHLPEDLSFFKTQTLGKTMIMGRRTYQSIGRPLPGRRSIVLTEQLLTIPGVEIAHSIQEALDLCSQDLEVMVIGGATVFQKCLPLAQTIYQTLIHHQFAADTYFPQFDQSLWRMTVLKEFAADAKNPYDLTFMRYDKI